MKTLVGTYDSITQVKLAAASLNVFFFGEFSQGDDKKKIHCQLNKEFLWENTQKLPHFEEKKVRDRHFQTVSSCRSPELGSIPKKIYFRV
jgi:hypothetical protein